MYLILGMRELQFQNSQLEGHNLSFEKSTFDDKKYEIVVMSLENNDFYKITCYTSHGMCGSGWTTASWGHMEAEKIDAPGSLHYTPLMSTELESIEFSYRLENSLFEYSEYGGCNYYPSGSFEIKLDGWRSTGRKPKKPMVHVFHGCNASGKSTIASLTEKNVIESDSFESGDKFINAINLTEPTENTIFVIGGKHNDIDLDTVVSLLEENNTVVKVEFSL